MQAMTTLMNNKNLIIKSAEKGEANVIMNR